MKQIRDRVAGLDIHRDTVVACARIGGPTGIEVTKESFPTTRAGLVKLASFLSEAGVTTVAMESTGVYWKPVVRHEAPSNQEEMKGLLLRAVAAAR